MFWANSTTRLRKFAKNASGNVAMLFTIAMVPLFLATNFALDYSTASTMRVNLQALADSVALAAVNKLPDESLGQNAGTEVYNAGIAEISAGLLYDNLNINLSVSPDYLAHVVITGAYKSPTGMTFNLGNMEFKVEAKAKIPLIKLEIAVAADATYSMRGTKISTLRTSLRNFVTTVLGAATDTAEVRLAIVPFSRAVTLPDYGASWIAGAGTTPTGAYHCATRRNGTFDSTDQNPVEQTFDGYSEIRNGCTDYKLSPLSKDETALLALAGSIDATGWGTANQVAADWVHHVLSPNWASQWPAASAPGAWDAATKIAVLMTDGANEFYDYTRDREGDTALAQTCETMKAKGIEIYAVTFMAPLSVRPIYEACVSRPANLIEASSNAQLIAAFERIADESTRRLVKLTN